MIKRPWQQVMDEQVAANTETRTERRSMAVNFPLSLYSVVAEAAEARGLNQTAYLRRAALAFAVHDLGLNWVEIMEDEPPIGTLGGGVRAGEALHGRGHGPWGITRLESHDFGD